MINLYINYQKVDFKKFIFSGGEVSVQFLPAQHFLYGNQAACKVQIEAHLRNAEDVMTLLMLTDALKRGLANTSLGIELEIPYFPYARQDRVCNEGEALSVKVMADLINSQGYKLVRIWDPHSDVTPALINNVVVVKQYRFVDKVFDIVSRDNTILVAPDAGANKKVMECAKALRIDQVVRADKTRDVKTGAITGTIAYTEHVGNKDFLMVDDIADGGMTFTELAKVLRPLTDGKIFLYVTHGIFSRGFDILRGHIDHVFTANCFGSIAGEEKFITQIKL